MSETPSVNDNEFYLLKKILINTAELLDNGGGGGVTSIIAGTGISVNQATGAVTVTATASAPAWGSITGTLSSQSDLNTALGLKAPLASPTFTGTPAAPTAAVDTNTTQVATTAYVFAERSNTATLTNKTLTSPTLTTPVLGTPASGNLANCTGVTIAGGGTGQTTAKAARNALNVGETALTDASTVATDCSTGNVFTLTLTATGHAMGAPSNLQAGATYIWKVKQGAAGGYTLSWNAVFMFPGGTDPVITTTANAIDVISGVSDGTNIYCSFIQDVK